MTPEDRARKIVWMRSGGACELCAAASADGMHHRVKRSHGGAWTAANLIHLCGSGTTGCHGRVEANPDLARWAGLWLFTGDNPYTTPALLAPFAWHLGWWYLKDDGCWTIGDSAVDTATRDTWAMLAGRTAS